MFALAGVVLPLVGLGDWAWRRRAGLAAAALFGVSMVLVVLLSSAIVMLINICVAATLNDRGVNTLVAPLVILLLRQPDARCRSSRTGRARPCSCSPSPAWSTFPSASTSAS